MKLTDETRFNDIINFPTNSFRILSNYVFFGTVENLEREFLNMFSAYSDIINQLIVFRTFSTQPLMRSFFRLYLPY